jgi:hypothetical protein
MVGSGGCGASFREGIMRSASGILDVVARPHESKARGQKVEYPLVAAHTLDAFPILESAGFSSRRPTRGPEYELVEAYVQSKLPPPPQGQTRTVFVEPRISSGFPDIVVVYWHVATAQRWSGSRTKLTPLDLRVVHYLATTGPADISQLQTVFSHGIRTALTRLHAAALIRRTAQVWRALTLDRIFAVRRLIAIEAKLDQWQRGLSQALQNTWYASESYLLLARLPRRPCFAQEASRLGIGVVTHDQPLEHAESAARREQLPKSYASWLFNDWAWRASLPAIEAQETPKA